METLSLLIRLILGFFLFIPIFFLIVIFEALNKDGNFSNTIEELKSFLNWLWPGIT